MDSKHEQIEVFLDNIFFFYPSGYSIRGGIKSKIKWDVENKAFNFMSTLFSCFSR